MNFLQQTLLGNTLGAYLAVVFIIGMMVLVKKFIGRYLGSLIYRIAGSLMGNIDRRIFLEEVASPISWFLLITVSVFTIDKLNFPESFQFDIYGHSTRDILQRAGIGIIILAFIRLLLRVVDFIARVLEEKASRHVEKKDNQLIVFFRDFFKVLIGLLGILWIIKVCFNQPIGELLTGLSIVGAAIALAAKESLENLIASFIIFFDKPFFTGDLVKLNNVQGTIEHIGLRSTRIRTADKTLVTVPNKQMVDSMVDNWSHRTARRAEIRFELEPLSSVARVRTFLDTLRRLFESKAPSVREPEVFLKDMGRTGILVTIEYFTAPLPQQEYDAIKQDLLLCAKEQMELLGLRMVSPVVETAVG
jgi:MscS family membrane protein